MSDERERHLCWMEMMWERYQSITREGKEEILRKFEEIAELSKSPMQGVLVKKERRRPIPAEWKT